MKSIEETSCENGHELAVELDGGRIVAAAVRGEADAWEFVSAAFCPKCGAELNYRITPIHY